MASIETALKIAGAVAFLLFGLSLIRDGMQTAMGFRMKRVLGAGTRTDARAFLSGLLVTLGLQPSTATALLTASFANQSMVGGRMAQIVMLGANVGTALTVAIVFSGVSALAPALLLIGYLASRRNGATTSGIGTALIGIGITFLALTLLETALEPMRSSPGLAQFLLLLGNALPVAMAVAAGLAVLCSSSLATVLLVASLGAPPAVTVAMVLGANLGGAIVPVLAVGAGNDPARRLAVGNLLIRGIGCILILPVADLAGLGLLTLPPDNLALAVKAHVAFNFALALLIWGFVGVITRIVARLLPDPRDSDTGWLDPALLASPPLALAGASREALAIGDLAERMMRQTHGAFRANETTPLIETAALERRIDERQQEVKNYLSRLDIAGSAPEGKNGNRILDYVINLEHIGDIIDKGIVPQLRRKVELGLQFSEEGQEELDRMFQMTLQNLHMAQTVFMTGDRRVARMLVESKVDVRRFEQKSSQRHLMRYRDGRPESRETSSLHLDMLRDLKRINAHAVSVAVPILSDEGQMIESRLVLPDHDAVGPPVIAR